MKNSGLTLIEILVVIAILGIILVFAAPTWLREQQVQQLRAAQAQVSTIFERAQSLSRRYSYNYRISINPTNKTVEYFAVNSTNVRQTAYPSELQRLQSNISFIGMSSVTEFNYQAPYGRAPAGAASQSFQIGFGAGANDLKTRVDIIGVTGMVVQRGITQ